MGGHHHRSGPLKQKNKKHKTGRHDSKTSLTKKLGGKIERVGSMKASSNTNNAVAANQKAQRMQRQKQLRQNKREDLLLQKRFGSGSSLGPPKIIAVIALSDLANLGEVKQSIFEGVSTIEEPFQVCFLFCIEKVHFLMRDVLIGYFGFALHVDSEWFAQLHCRRLCPAQAKGVRH